MAGDSIKPTDVPASRNHDLNQKVTEASQSASASNVFSEFALAAYQSGVQRPVDSVKQLVGMDIEPVKADENLSGMMKVSNVVGCATGQILDFLVLNKIASTAVGKIVSSAGKESVTAAVLAEGTITRAATTSAAVGFVNGALLTPLQENESVLRRLGNGAVDAASFSALGSVSAKYAGKFGDNLLGRAGVAALSGVAGGATNSILDPISHGRAPELSQVAETTVAWAAGGVIAGESMRAFGNGLNLAGKQLSQAVDSAKKAPPAVENFDLNKTGKPEEQTHSTGLNDSAPIQEVQQMKLEVQHQAHERIAPELKMLSMREIAERGDLTQLNERLTSYYPELEKAFPLPGEIESTETYVNYLTDKEFPWEMEQLLGKDGKVRGGLQYQILDVDGEKINKAGWLEHIWVKDGARSEGYGSALLDHVQSQIQKKGGDLTFWEFNNPDKMTPDEIEEDAKGGITTQDRVDYWAKRGAYVAVIPSTGELAFYAQPGMDGQEEVAYLSTAWNAPGGLDGQKISIDDYKKTMLAAHSTIVDVNEDPTVKHYVDQLDALPDTHLEFVRLSDYLEQRAKQLDIEHQQGSPDAEIRRNRWIGADSAVARGATLLDVADVPNANPEIVKAQGFQEASASSAPWNRTADVTQRYSSFEGHRDADVVVVGGGLVGLQTAHELGSHGINTVLLDKGLVGAGTSRFMGAMGTYAEDSGFKGIFDAHGADGFASRLEHLIASRSSVQRLARRYGADWQDVDSFNISYEHNDPALREEVDLLHKFGDLEPRFVTGDYASQLFGSARSAIIFPSEGNLNPYKFSLGLAGSRKFTVHENSPVLGIAAGAAGDGVDVFSPGGTIHAKKVVFATNGPAPMFSHLEEHLIPVQCFATTADIGQKLPGNFFDTDSTAFTYWRQFGVKPFGPTETLVGGTARFLNEMTAEPDSPRLNARVGQLFDGAVARNPITALIHTAYSDGLPIAGPHPKYPDLWSATGAGGTGLVNGNWMARTIRQQLQDPSTRNLISPDRFAN